MRVEQAIERAATVAPDKVALRHGDRAWTYAEVRAERERRAALLIDLGLGVGDRLVLAERVSGEQVITCLACARAGGIFAGLPALLTPPELAALTERIAPRLACTGAGSPHAGLPAPLTLPLALPGLPTATARRELARRAALASEDDPCEIRATSGTTGQRPKLVLSAHRTNGRRCSTAPWTTASEMVHCGLTTATINMGAICRTFAVGGTVVVPETIGVYGLEEELARRGVTAITATPALVGALVRQELPPPPGLRLRSVQTSGATLTEAVRLAAAARYGATIQQRYGMSECVGIMVVPATGAPPGSVGKPSADMEIRLLGDAGEEVPVGAIGELVVRSPGMMLGYWDDPAATAAALRDGWLHTGDGARRDDEGFFYIVGRRGLQINVGGAKVAPEEVEAVLLQHPGVREAVVVPQPDALRGEVVRAIVVPADDPPPVQELRRHCRARLAGYKVPRTIEFRDEPLPRSALGKVLRRQL